MGGLGEIVDPLQLDVAVLGELLHVAAAIGKRRRGQAQSRRDCESQGESPSLDHVSNNSVGIEANALQLARRSPKIKAKARLTPDFRRQRPARFS
jgi:hypothetical protein